MTSSPPAALLEVTADVIAVGPDLTGQLEAGLSGLLELLGAGRGDAGFVGPTSSTYRPAHHSARPDVPVVPFEVPIDDPVVEAVLGSSGAFLVTDVRDDLPPGPVRELLVDTGTRSIVVQRLDHNDDGYGLVCIDWVGREAAVSTEALELVEYFVSRIWTPLLLRAAHDRSEPDRLAPLTTAERAVVELAASGLSYREIAANRRTSVNTVGQQLRSARAKVGARNTAELCALVPPAPAPPS